MKIYLNDKKHGIVKVVPTTKEDLWLLSQLVLTGARVSGMTTRKIKLSETKVDKKTFYLDIIAEKAEFENEILRVSGTVASEIEEIPKGSHHTLSFDIHNEVKIQQNWMKYQLDRLSEAAKERINILLAVMDRENVFFAKLEPQGYKLLVNFEGDVEKKAEGTKSKGGFYKEVEQKMLEYVERFSIHKIVLASPAFFKEDFLKQMADGELKKKIILATCSSVSENAFTEILKRDEVKSALSQERLREEITAVELLLSEIAIEGKSCYGLSEVGEMAGAIQELLLTTGFLSAMRETKDFSSVDSLMTFVEKNNGQVMIINSGNEAGKKLDGISGIGAILRYKKY